MFIVLDLETTGIDSFNDKIIEIAMLKVDSITFEVLDSFSSLVNPGIEIPELISDITGITTKDVLNKPYIDEIDKKIEDFIGDLPILGHNIEFDLNFLKVNVIDFSSHIILDTMYLANFLLISHKSLSLENLGLYFNINISGAHRSLKDVSITLNVFKNLVGMIKNLDNKYLSFVKYFFKKTNNLGLDFIFNRYLKNLKIDNFDKTKFHKELLKILKKHELNEIFIVDEKIKVDKLISNLKGLEIRKNQEKMLNIVDNCLEKNRLSIIEAPTGLGKTFAYLIPSIIYSINSGEQVIISTTTKTLQDQIFYKDLEFLKKNLSYNFSYTKLKGKNNYISVFQFFKFLEDREVLSIKETSFILKIIFWLFRTNSFELDELDYIGEEYNFLKEINADNFIVLSKRNIYYKREPLVFYRTQAKRSNIIVINNSILFQDIDNENLIFGKIKNLILDEAHNLEDVITDSLKKGFFKKDFEKNTGILLNILKKYRYESIIKIEQMFEKLLFDINFIFDVFREYFIEKSNHKNNDSILLKDDFFKVDNIDIMKLTRSVKNNFLSIIDLLNLLPEELYLDINSNISYLENTLDIIDKLLNNSRKDLIKIIKNTKYKEIGIEYSLLNIGEFLRKNLWNKIDSCILASATFTTNNNFLYLENILALENFDRYILQSDFDYKKQVLLYLPDDIGYIKNNLIETIEFLKEFFIIVGGHTLVLFRALYTIKEVYLGLVNDLKKQKIHLFAQGIGGSKHKLLKLYEKDYKNSIIMGSDTFWEGIDLTGDKLKYLVIHKIPFIPPNDPIFQSRSILFKDSFRDYSIPKAIIKLKQGFGRLIRTKRDFGIVIFLDNRIFSTSWGNLILEAFPKDIKIKKGSKYNLFKVLELNKEKK